MCSSDLITNVMNDQYCYQTSKKIRQVFDMKRRNGEFIGSYAPYGYIKDPQDKHALLVDPEAAEIVKRIFSMFLSGKNKRGITLYLNDHGVPCPTVYKQSQGLKYNAPNAQGNPMWSTITIDTILKNRVNVGDMVQGRQRVKSYKIHIQERVPEEEWFIVENTHEAIIDRETFDKVQGLLKRDTRTAPKQKQLYLFSGFLKCADCGRAMSRIASKGTYVYYQCGTYKSLSKTACTMHSIKNTRLEVGVLFAIQQQVHLAVTYSELVSRINAAPLKKSKSCRLEDMIAIKEKELSKIMRYKQALYQDWKDGEITLRVSPAGSSPAKFGASSSRPIAYGNRVPPSDHSLVKLPAELTRQQGWDDDKISPPRRPAVSASRRGFYKGFQL